MHLGALTLHHHAVYGVVVWTQADGSDVLFVAQPEDGFIADIRDAGENHRLLYGDGEIAAGVGHSAAEQRRVFGIEHGDIGEGDGLSLLVGHVSYEVAVGLVRTLHEYLMRHRVACVNGHADGIEAYHLLYGVGQRLVLNICRHAEILQFVI